MKTSFAIATLSALSWIGVLLLTGNWQPPAQPPRFKSLGDLPGGIFDSIPYGISADGQVVVGYSNSAAGMQAFRWTPAGGIHGLDFVQAFAASADGSTVVGYRHAADHSEPVVWTPSGARGLGKLPEFEELRCGRALCVSADGSVVVGGYLADSGNGDAPFRWTQQDGLATLDSSKNIRGQIRSVSADGRVFVGALHLGAHRREAFRWTKETGIVPLGTLPGDTHSAAQAVSADGSVVVGSSASIGREAFRWSEQTGMISLGTLPGGSRNSRALAVSADGSVVVGECHGESGLEAFFWDANNGMRSIRQVLTKQLNLAEGLCDWKLVAATAVSADGSTIVGYCLNPDGNREAWLVQLGVRSNSVRGRQLATPFPPSPKFGPKIVAEIPRPICYGRSCVPALVLWRAP